MPILRRSISTSQNPPEPINADAEVFCCLRTGEFFATYAEYVERVALYNKPVWTCRLTGHTGMTYDQARSSELAAQKVLEGFNEWWKPYCLTSIHCSTESIDALAGRMANYLKTHLVLNEPVKMPFDDTVYDGIVSTAPPFPESAETEAAPSAPTTYRISINQEDLIMDGACRGPEDVMRQYNPPSRSLLKKFIRSVAVRYGHTGMPWIVREDLLTRHHIQKKIDPEMAERIKSVLSQRKRKEQNIIVGLPTIRKEPPSSTDKQSGQEEVIKYPILDEFVPLDKQTDPNNWPSPKPFNPNDSIVAQGLFAELLELWHFIHSFSPSIQVTPMSLHCLFESLEYCENPNPIFESLCTSFSAQLDRNLRTSKLREERIEQYVGNATSADLPPFSYVGPPRLGEKENEEADQELENYLSTTIKSRKDSAHWSSRIIEFLFEVRRIPEARSILEVMMKTRQRFYELPGYLKLQCLLILRNLYVTCVSLRPVVDREVEIAADAKHRIRELESERRKVVKEGQDMMNEHDEMSKKLEHEEHSTEELRALKKAARSLDIRIGKSSKTEERLSHEIMTTKNKRYEHSACRILPLGEDRLFRRYWWMDMHLIKPSARAHSTGLVLVETPNQAGAKDNIPSSWAYYDREEEVEGLISFLNPLGCREARLGAVLTQHREAIAKSLAPFPLAKGEGEEATTTTNSFHKQEQKIQEDSSEEEEMPVVMRRRAVKRRAPVIDVEPVAEFLRYRNTFRSAQGKKAFVSSR